MQTITQPILFIGGGNMAHAIISGAQNAKAINPSRIGVIEPSADRRELYANAFEIASEGLEWLGSLGATNATVVLAVKPQMLDTVAAPLRAGFAHLPIEPAIVSILAGTPIAKLEHAFGSSARIIRVMPNTPAQIGLGMSAIAPSDRSSQEDIELVEQLFSSIGKSITISEDLMDAFTGIAGSGPAYVFYLAQGMIQAAIELGFDRHQAQTIVRQTILGSATLMAKSPESPKELRTKVTSKNGTTHAATTSLDEAGVMDAIVRAIHAARHRGAQLARGE